MHDGPTLAQWELDERLSLIALIKPEFLEHQSALIDYNVGVFRDSILSIQALEAAPAAESEQS